VLLSCFSESAGKNPVPTEEIDQALSRLEILSVDTASVFSDELDTCPNKLAPGIDIDGDQDIIALRVPPRRHRMKDSVPYGDVILLTMAHLLVFDVTMASFVIFN
jgi:hypothetical protein